MKSSPTTDEAVKCFHCGLPCPPGPPRLGDKAFCCHGCRAVYRLLSEAGLDGYYKDDPTPGRRPENPSEDRFSFLDHPKIRSQLVDFDDGRHARLRMKIPAIHCASCIWLLENLYRLHPGVVQSRVDFTRKELSATLELERLQVGDFVRLLSRLGYEPDVAPRDKAAERDRARRRRLYQRLGVAGFCYGNIMLFSFPEYLGLGGPTDATLRAVFNFASAALSLPVLLFSAGGYLSSAWSVLRHRALNIDVPIALGMVTLFLYSWYAVMLGTTPYFDSLAGLTFFLLIGRLFQQKTYDRLSFERDYRSYFPLSVQRRTDSGTEVVPLEELAPGDLVIIRHQELVPADAVLSRGEGLIDYSFVTGESEPRTVAAGDKLFAGGRQVGTTVEIEITEAVSRSRLISLWHDADRSEPAPTSSRRLVDQVARYFTAAVLGIALAGAGYWLAHDMSLALQAFVAVLIVACPCALALAGPFAFGTAMRELGRGGLFLKGADVVEALSGIDTIVFDKTGTLAAADERFLEFEGEPLSEEERIRLGSLTAHSTHPVSQAIHGQMPSEHRPVTDYREEVSRGVSGVVDGQKIRLGTRAWADGGESDDETQAKGTWLSIDGRRRGIFTVRDQLRPGVAEEIGRLSQSYRLAVMTGDSDRERERLTALFGEDSPLHFQQLPHNKRDEIVQLRRDGRRVLMVGDGLNDAGALEVATVGLAVSENLAAFSPASDGIVKAGRLAGLDRMLRLARRSVDVIWLCYALSFAYNLIGLGFAVTGQLSPLIASILMPLSSITIVILATTMTRLQARRTKVM